MNELDEMARVHRDHGTMREPGQWYTSDLVEIVNELRKYPPLVEYLGRMVLAERAGSLDDYRLSTPSDILGDRALFAVFALRGHSSLGPDSPADRRQLAQTILEAVPVLWQADMFAIARSLDLPAHIIAPDVLPYESMWWVFERDRGKDSEPIHAMLVLPEPDAFSVLVLGQEPMSADGRSGGGVKVHALLRFPYFSRWPDDYLESGLESNDFVLQLLAFMNSRFVNDQEAPLHRAERKRIVRANIPNLDQPTAVHVITVRSPEPPPAERADTEGVKREWAHRWIVRGHYRAQWYSSLKAHRVRWIAPYIKGPADKDLSMPVAKVSR